MIDLMGGRVQAAITNMLTAAPLVRNGKIRALAVTSPQRSPAMPDLPTVDESGIRGYELRSWYGLVAPRNTPSVLVRKITPHQVADRQVPLVTFFLLLIVYAVVTLEKIKLCVALGVETCK